MQTPQPAPERAPDQSPAPARSAEAAPAAPVATRLTRSGVSVSIAPHTIWYAVVAVVAIAVGWMLITRALPALLIFFVAVIIGEAARPLVLRMERRHVPRPLGVVIVLLVAIAVLGVLIWIMLTPLVGEAAALSANAPTYTRRLQGWFANVSAALHANQQIGSFLDSIAGQFVSSLQGFAPSLISVPFTLISGAFGALLSVVITLTITVFWLSSSTKLKIFLLSLVPQRLQPNAEEIFADMARSLGGYVRGVLIAMLLIGVLTGLGLGILDVPYALLLGVLAGLTEAIPYVGPWLSGSVAVIVALVTVDPVKALEVIVLFLLIQQLEGNLVQPLVMSRSVHLDPLLVLVAILIGSELLGLMGAILAVPFAALLQSLMTYAVAPALRYALGATQEPPAPPPPVGPPAPRSDAASVEARAAV